MKYLKNKLFRTYGNNQNKPAFTLEDLKYNGREVQKEYPIYTKHYIFISK